MGQGVCSLQDRSSLGRPAGTWEGPLTLSHGRERDWPAREKALSKHSWPAAGALPSVHLASPRPAALAPLQLPVCVHFPFCRLPISEGLPSTVN